MGAGGSLVVVVAGAAGRKGCKGFEGVVEGRSDEAGGAGSGGHSQREEWRRLKGHRRRSRMLAENQVAGLAGGRRVGTLAGMGLLVTTESSAAHGAAHTALPRQLRRRWARAKRRWAMTKVLAAAPLVAARDTWRRARPRAHGNTALGHGGAHEASLPAGPAPCAS